MLMELIKLMFQSKYLSRHNYISKPDRFDKDLKLLIQQESFLHTIQIGRIVNFGMLGLNTDNHFVPVSLEAFMLNIFISRTYFL